MCGDVLVAFLVTTVLGDVVQIISAYNDGPVHLGGNADAFQDTATNGNISGEWALLVNVGSFDCGFWGLEAKANAAVVASGALNFLSQRLGLLSYEDSVLLLECFLVLFSHCKFLVLI